jgi:predicted alpha/beta hydrolase family esterase
MPVLLAHSAGPQGRGEGSSQFAERLREGLGPRYELNFPLLPDPEDPHYEPWSRALGELIAGTDEPPIVVGHSLGGSVILKLLAESDRPVAIDGLVLVATPFWGQSDWEAEWALPKGWPDESTELPRTFLFHSRDDEEIPVTHLERYAERLPQANAVPLDGNGHLFDRGDLTEILEAIRALAPS